MMFDGLLEEFGKLRLTMLLTKTDRRLLEARSPVGVPGTADTPARQLEALSLKEVMILKSGWGSIMSSGLGSW